MQTISVVSRWLQLVPPLMLRQIPTRVAASITWLFVGSNDSRLIYWKLLLSVPASWNQFDPPFRLLKIPAPRMASALYVPSPVPAYRMFVLDGSSTRHATARFPMKSFSGNQLAPPLIVFHTPPSTPPHHITFVN